MTQVWKDAEGNVINIGPWDYQEQEETFEKIEEYTEKRPILLNGEPFLDASGNKQYREVTLERTVTCTQKAVGNPLPEGAYTEEADVLQGNQGGLYVFGDPRIEQENIS